MPDYNHSWGNVEYCENCGGLRKVIVFQSLEGPIAEPVCTWDACNIEVTEQRRLQQQQEFEEALKIAANPDCVMPEIVQDHIKATRVLELLRSR